jgi:hypothetical protein
MDGDRETYRDESRASELAPCKRVGPTSWEKVGPAFSGEAEEESLLRESSGNELKATVGSDIT